MKRMRSRRVLELGTGPTARKLVALALKHPRNTFIGSEAVPVHYGFELKERGQHTKPRNLDIRRNRDALAALREQRDGSISHAYAHFLFQHLSHHHRQTIFKELRRVLEPNARFVTIEDGIYGNAFKAELVKNGFTVTMRRISPEELLRLGTHNADMNAAHILRLRETLSFFDTFDTLSRKLPKSYRGPKSREEAIKSDSQHMKQILREKWAKLEGANPSQDVRAFIRQALEDVPVGYRARPFVVMTVRKSR